MGIIKDTLQLMCLDSLMSVVDGRFAIIEQKWARTIGSVLQSCDGATMIVGFAASSARGCGCL